MRMTSIKTYSDLRRFQTFEERYNYLRLRGAVGQYTFGFDRHLNQVFYKSYEWAQARREVIIRDEGCDLGVPGFEIHDKVLIHHMNPITEAEIRLRDDSLIDPEFLICTTHKTHNAIHFGDESQLLVLPKERRRGDTKLW